MPHRSISEWAVWMSHEPPRALPENLEKSEKVQFFINSKLSVIRKTYSKWYADEPMEKPAVPEELSQYPVLVGMDFDLVRWFSLLPGNKTTPQELTDEIDDCIIYLDNTYPHMSMTYLEKMAKNRFDPLFYMKAREAKMFFDDFEHLYDEWLAQAFPEYYASSTSYKFVDTTRRLDSQGWNKIDLILSQSRGKRGREVVKELSEYLPAKLVQEAFYRSSGLTKPALRFLKTYGDASVRIPGVWTTQHDYDLFDNNQKEIRKLHGDKNVQLRRRFLKVKAKEISKKQTITAEVLTMKPPNVRHMCMPETANFPVLEDYTTRKGLISKEMNVMSLAMLEELPDEAFGGDSDDSDLN